MGGTSEAERRLVLTRQLHELDVAFRQAAAARSFARDHGDTLAEARCDEAIETAFRTRDDVLARLDDLGVDRAGGPVRQSVP